MTAKYLLRFDDLCPTTNQQAWERFERLIVGFKLKPILAVVPDNRDPDLMLEAPDPAFWERMRRLEQAGATIGLHGLSHVCEARGRSLIPLHRQTEFAGAPKERQREWIQAGLRILRGHGLQPKIWVAPRHGFDATTLEVLRDAGIGLVSDGFARLPFEFGGLIWIPQQLWEPVEKTHGVWTICLHANTAREDAVRRLEAFLEKHSASFASVNETAASGAIRQRSLGDRWFHAAMLSRIAVSRWRRQRRRTENS